MHPSDSTALTLTLWIGLVLLLLGGVLLSSWLLGPRHRAPRRDQPYESGVEPAGTARLRFGAHFYLVGVFFLLFDLETVVLFAWAVVGRELGWPGLGSALLFLATLAAGLVHVWKEGGLDWYRPTRAVSPAGPGDEP